MPWRGYGGTSQSVMRPNICLPQTKGFFNFAGGIFAQEYIPNRSDVRSGLLDDKTSVIFDEKNVPRAKA